MTVSSPGRIVSNDRRLADGQLDVFGDLVVDGDDDLALVRRLVSPLHVLDLQGVGGTGSVVAHTEKQTVK